MRSVSPPLPAVAAAASVAHEISSTRPPTEHSSGSPPAAESAAAGSTFAAAPASSAPGDVARAVPRIRLVAMPAWSKAAELETLVAARGG